MSKQDPATFINVDSDPVLSKSHLVQKPASKHKDISDIPKYHWVRDKVDIRDHRYKLTGDPTPNTVDLRPWCTMIEDQGNLGSCTGQAIAGAIELLVKRNIKAIDVSRLFIYYYERLLLGTINRDSGAYIRDGIKACYTYGAPIEKLWPYNIAKFKIKPSTAAIKDAVTRKVTSYQRRLILMLVLMRWQPVILSQSGFMFTLALLVPLFRGLV